MQLILGLNSECKIVRFIERYIHLGILYIFVKKQYESLQKRNVKYKSDFLTRQIFKDFITKILTV